MAISLVLAGSLSLVNILFNRSRWLASSAFMLVLLTALLGGHKVPVGDFADGTPYIGLDWFILDLLGSALIFIFHRKIICATKKTSPCSGRSGKPTFSTSSSITW